MAALLVAMFAMPAFADQRDFTVVNNTSMTLTNLYVSASDTAAWGDDILGRAVLGSTETASVTFGSFDAGACFYDVKVLASEGQAGYLYKVDLCTISVVTFNDAAPTV
jgi:hypothetical protein